MQYLAENVTTIHVSGSVSFKKRQEYIAYKSEHMKISKRNKMAAYSFRSKVTNGFLDIGKTMGSV